MTNGTKTPIRKVVILGDNRLATSLISGLTTSPDLEIHQITHAQSTLSSTSSFTIHKGDLTLPSLTTLFTTLAPDILFNTYLPASSPFQTSLIDAVINTKIPRFVPAEFNHDSLNPDVQTRLPPVKERAEILAYLQARESSIEWTTMATGCTPLDHALLSGTLGFDLKWQSATIPGSGDSPFAASSSAWIGRVACSIITHWDEIKNRHLYAAGLMTTGNEIVRCLERQTGQKWEVGHVEVEDLVREGERRFERGFADAGVVLMERSVVFDEQAVDPFITKESKTLLGLPDGEDLKKVIGRVVHEYEHDGGRGDCGCE